MTCCGKTTQDELFVILNRKEEEEFQKNSLFGPRKSYISSFSIYCVQASPLSLREFCARVKVLKIRVNNFGQQMKASVSEHSNEANLFKTQSSSLFVLLLFGGILGSVHKQYFLKKSQLDGAKNIGKHLKSSDIISS